MIQMTGHAVPEHPLVAYMRGHAVAKDVQNRPRWVTHFNGADVYGEVESYTFVGDADIGVVTAPSNMAVNQTLFSGTDYRFQIISTGELIMTYRSTADVRVDFGFGLVPDIDQISSIFLKRRGDNFTAYLNEVAGNTRSIPDIKSFDLRNFGKNVSGLGGSDYLKGGVPEGNAYDLTLPADDQFVRGYRFDRKDGVIRNYAPCGELGPNLIDLATLYVNEADNFARDGNNLSWLNHTTWGQYQFSVRVALKPGRSYLLSTNMTNAGRVGLKFPTANTDAPNGWIENNYYGCYKDIGNGEKVTVITIPSDADVTAAKLLVAPTVTTFNDLDATVSRLELKEAEGWGQMLNLTADSVHCYWLESEGDLVGIENLVVNGEFDTDSDWTQYGTSISNGRMQFGAGLTYADNSAPLTEGKYHRISYNLHRFFGGLVGVSSNSFTGGYSSNVGRFSFDAIANRPYLRVVSTEGGNELTKLEVQRLIPASPLYKLRRRIKHLLQIKAGQVRPIPRFDGVNMYGEFPPKVYVGDFETESIVLLSELKNFQTLWDSSIHENKNESWVYEDGRFAARLRGGSDLATVVSAAGIVEAGKVSSFKTQRVGQKGLLIYNGNLVATGDIPIVGDVTIDGLGGISNSKLKGSFLAHAEIDLTDPLNKSSLYLLDDATGILYDALSENGPELTTGNIAKAGNCILDGDTVTNTNGGWGYLFEDIPVEVGTPYLVKGAADFVGAGGGWRLHVWENNGGSYSDLVKIDGEESGVEALVVSSAPTIRVGLEYLVPLFAGDQITRKLISVKKEPNAGQIHNAPTDAYPYFIYQGDQKKEWLSPELSLISDISNLSPSSTSGEWEYFNLVRAEIGRSYRLATDVQNTVPGKPAGFSGSAGVPGIQPYRVYADGAAGGEFTALATDHIRLFKHAGSNVHLSNTTVRELLKEAY